MIKRRETTWENVARFAHDVYEGFQRREQTLAVAVDLEDAYNREQFKLLMDLLVHYGVSLRSQAGSQQHSRKERLPCDLETGSPSPNN